MNATMTQTVATMASLKALWAKIRNRRQSMWCGMHEVEQAAALLYGPGAMSQADAAAYSDSLCEEWHGPNTYWRKVASIIREAH